MAIEEEINTDPSWPSTAISSVSLADLMRQESEISPDYANKDSKLQPNGSLSFLQSDIDLDSSHSSSVLDGMSFSKHRHRHRRHSSGRKRQDSVTSYENPVYITLEDENITHSPPSSPKANVPLLPFAVSPQKQKAADQTPLVTAEEAIAESRVATNVGSNVGVSDVTEGKLPPQVTRL